MANTMAAPVANSIVSAESYLPRLDAIYKRESLTSILDTASERVEFIGAKTVKIYKPVIDGLGNYSRNAGFVPGSADNTWETLTLDADRGRSFAVDVMDNDEGLGMAFGTLLSEFERTAVVPEVDQYRFAKYSASAGTRVNGALTTGAAAAIQTAEAAMDNDEVPYEGRILFVHPNVYKVLKSDITRYTLNGDPDVNGEVEMYDGMRVIRVPGGRFATTVTLANPSAATDAGGFTPGSSLINFMIVHPSAIVQTVKHQIPRIFSPELNQEADAWKLNYRIYHGAWVLQNKTKGIYLHATAADA